MRQRWTDLAFVHWRYEPDAVQRLLPAGLTVDTFDGSAWVGLIPFTMRDVSVPGTRSLPHVGRFPEVNVRTYVRRGPHAGVWFFSLDIDRYLPAVTARVAYRLPYCVGHTSHARVGHQLVTSVERRWPRPDRPADTRMAVTTFDEPVIDDPLSVFLTARWGLFSRGRAARLRWAPVEHEPWPLYRAHLDHLDDRLVTAARLHSPTGEPHVVWTPGVSVRIGRPTRA